MSKIFLTTPKKQEHGQVPQNVTVIVLNRSIYYIYTFVDGLLSETNGVQSSLNDEQKFVGKIGIPELSVSNDNNTSQPLFSPSATFPLILSNFR